MKIYAYGYELSLKNFAKLFIFRIFCNHKEAKFHACTGADLIGNGENVEVGVSFVCPKCHRSWTGNIRACAPNTTNKPLRAGAESQFGCKICSRVDGSHHTDCPEYKPRM